MVNLVRKHWPLIAALAVLWAIIAVLFVLSTRQNQGHLIYALDDPYIHMAMAKNFAEHGVWGIDKGGFSSSSSSPLWTLLLSFIYLLFGTNEISPFVLNVIFATVLIALVHLFLRRYALRPFFIFITLLAMAYFTPLPRLVFLGQEHVMHTVLSILFMCLAGTVLSGEKIDRKKYVSLLILAPLVVMVRYEGLFLMLVVSVLFALRKRLSHSFFLAGMGVLPAVIYGAISMSKGWFFLPNPILIKGKVPDLSSFLSPFGGLSFLRHSADYAYRQMLLNPHMLFLILLALILFILRCRRREGTCVDVRIMMAIFVGTAFLHMSFGRVDGSFRYEAYLVALGLFSVVVAAGEYLPERFSLPVSRSSIPKYLAQALVALIILMPLEMRARSSLSITPRATTNIYEQQYQMGLFVKKYYQGQCVAANDIGAINYLADIRCLDLFGLGNTEPVKLVKEGRYDSRQIYNLAKRDQAKIAIVYDQFFERFGGLPTQWNIVGKWKIVNNIACAEDEISFYAVDPSEADNLNRNLRAFSSYLPASVVQVVAKIGADSD